MNGIIIFSQIIVSKRLEKLNKMFSFILNGLYKWSLFQQRISLILLLLNMFLKSLSFRDDLFYNVQLKGGKENGDWQRIIYCPNDSWVRGFRHKTQNETFFFPYDNFGTVLVEIECYYMNGTSAGNLTSNSDYQYSKWSSKLTCEGVNNFILGAQLKVADESVAVTGVNMVCLDDNPLAPGNNSEYPDGDIFPFDNCTSHSAVCGIRSNFMAYSSKILTDNSALNSLMIYCCGICDFENGQYYDKNTKKCKQCSYKCKSCNSASSCLSCYKNDILQNNSCVVSKDWMNALYTKGWTGFPKNETSECGDIFVEIMGGYNIFGQGARVELAYYDLPPHFNKFLQFHFIKIGVWREKKVFVRTVNDILIEYKFTKYEGLLSGKHCSQYQSAIDSEITLETEIKNSDSSFFLNVTTDISSNDMTAYWGVSGLYFAIELCHYSCQSCTNKSETSCLTCYENADYDNGKCNCKQGFKLFEVGNCAESTSCFRCRKCIDNCSDCNYQTNKCNQCSADSYLSDGLCYYKRCPFGKFGNSSSFICENNNCPESTHYLDSKDNICKECSNPYFKFNGVCMANCPENYFPVAREELCSRCNDKCLTCSGDGFNECLSCARDLFLQNKTCVANCTAEMFFKNKETSTCLTNCPEGKYGDKISFECLPCNSACKTCRGVSSSDCLECKENMYKYLNKAGETTCVYCNNSFEYVDQVGNVCRSCHDNLKNCKVCYGDSNNCEICENNFFLFQSKPDGNFDQCLSCIEPSLYKEGEFCRKCKDSIPFCDSCQKNSSCDKCETGYFLFQPLEEVYTICLLCNVPDKYREKEFCFNCNYSMKNCSTCRQKDICDSCDSGYYLWKESELGPYQKCDKCQSSNSYVEGENCKYCRSSIAGCIDCYGNKYNCSKCEQGLYPFQHKSDGIFGECIPCVDGNEYINQNGACVLCEITLPGCLKCNKDATKCLKCKNGYMELFPEKGLMICKPCPSGVCLPSPVTDCETYYDYSSCKSCRDLTFLLVFPYTDSTTNQVSFRYSCVEKCEDGYFSEVSHNNCSRCNVSCKTCEGSKYRCTSCEGTRVNANNICVEECEQGQYFVPINRTIGKCVPCHETCLTCFGEGSNSCKSCKPVDKFLKGTTCVNVENDYNFTLISVEPYESATDKGFLLIFNKELNPHPYLILERLFNISVRSVNNQEFDFTLKLDEENPKILLVSLGFGLDLVDPIISIGFQEFTFKFLKDKNNQPLKLDSKLNQSQINVTLKTMFEGKKYISSTEEDVLSKFKPIIISLSSFILFSNIFTYAINIERISTFWIYIDALQTISLMFITNIYLPSAAYNFYSIILFSHLDFISFYGKSMKNNQLYYFSTRLNQTIATTENPFFQRLSTSSFMCNGFQALACIIILLVVLSIVKIMIIYFLRKGLTENRTFFWLDIFKDFLISIIIRATYLFFSLLTLASFLQLLFFNNPPGAGTFLAILTAAASVGVLVYFYKLLNNPDVYQAQDQVHILEPLFCNLNLDYFHERNHNIFVMIRKMAISAVIVFLYSSPLAISIILMLIHIASVIKNAFKNPFSSRNIQILNILTDILVTCETILLLLMAKNTNDMKLTSEIASKSETNLFDKQRSLTKAFIIMLTVLCSVFFALGLVMFLYYALKNIVCLLNFFVGFGVVDKNDEDENSEEDNQESGDQEEQGVEMTNQKRKTIIVFNNK